MNQLWEDSKTEFWALKLILQHSVSSEDGPMPLFDAAAGMQDDPRKELAALKAQHGGMALAEKLLTPWLRSRIRLYVEGSRASWTWFTEQVTSVKTPKDGLSHFVRVANGGWQKEIKAIVAILTKASSLRDCDLLPGASVLSCDEQAECSKTLFAFIGTLIGHRSFTGIMHDCPPFCYAAVLSSNAAAKQDAVDMMKRDWAIVVALENVVHNNAVAAQVVNDLTDVFPPCVRIMYLAFEKDSWSAASIAGRRVLGCMLKGLPDSKLVEDTHQHLRDLQRHNRSHVSSKVRRMMACVASNNLELRGIEHRKITKGEFAARFVERVPPLADKFKSRKHKMQQDWYELLDKRDWVSPTPESSRASWVCWLWARAWFSEQGGWLAGARDSIFDGEESWPIDTVSAMPVFRT